MEDNKNIMLKEDNPAKKHQKRTGQHQESCHIATYPTQYPQRTMGTTET